MLKTKATSFYRSLSKKWKRKRLLKCFELLSPIESSTLIDMGGGSGSFFSENKDLIEKYKINVVIADIDKINLEKASARGFKTILLGEHGFSEFADDEFDIVFCNSVIEHVTTPKKNVWEYTDQSFYKEAFKTQKEFAESIERISKQYFVQTPHRFFPIESHSWTPALYSYPDSREKHVKRLGILKKYWIKETQPDFNLLTEQEMRFLFPGATDVYTNRVFGLPKEIIAYRS